MAEDYEDNELENKDEEQESNEEKGSKSLEEIVNLRLRKEREAQKKREAEHLATIANYERQLAEKDDTISNSKANSTSAEPTIPVSAASAYANQLKLIEKHKEELDNAIKEDKEFAELAKTGNSIPGELRFQTLYLDNAPAVLKHLLKSKKDHAYVMAAAEQNKAELIKALNYISDKVEEQIEKNKPHPSQFEPAPSLVDSGEGGEDFNLEDYAKKKLKTR